MVKAFVWMNKTDSVEWRAANSQFPLTTRSSTFTLKTLLVLKTSLPTFAAIWLLRLWRSIKREAGERPALSP